MKNRRIVESLAIVALFAVAVFLPRPAMAYGEEITSAGNLLYTWFRSVGALIIAFGLCGVGFKLTVSHDREGLGKLVMVIAGGLLVFLAPSFVQVLQNVAPASTINTAD